MTRNLSKLASWCKLIANTLWLSVSSASFYADVHRLYRGYGVRYILNLYLISGLVFCLWAFNQMIRFEEEMSPANPDVEYILRQIPEIYYDGKLITTKAETPFFLYSTSNRKIAAIDPDGELGAADTKDIPFLFLGSYLKTPIESVFSKGGGASAEYKSLFGTGGATVTSQTIVQYLPQLWKNINNIYIYVLVPTVGALYFGITLLCNIFYAAVVWFIGYFLGIATNPQTAYRLTMFASGPALFLQPLIIITAPNLLPILNFVSLAAWIFMVMGLVQLKKR
jgi:hypothetical protein